MKNINVASLSDATNYAVIKLPERRFPALLVQGDSLKIMADLAQEIERMVKDSPGVELRLAAEELARQLSSRVEHYEHVLADEKLQLPYMTLKATV